jgi:site-specific DNA recombinase
MAENKVKRCAIYTRKSVEDGLDMEFNSLDAQREAAENYIASQKSNGWRLLPDRYDDGGFSGGNTNRPALKRLLADCEAGKIDIIVVYKIDRLSRSICDFAELSNRFDKWNVAFVSVTQEINTHTSAGRMMLNILVTFAQFEREVITERVRDKMAASRRKGKWVGGTVPYGYRVEKRRLYPNEEEAAVVNRIFRRYLEVQSPKLIAMELNKEGVFNHNGRKWDTQSIHRILTNHHYVGEVEYQGAVYKGEHEGVVPRDLWDRCREIMSGDAPKPDRSRNTSDPALLQGVLRCGHCQSMMTPARVNRRGRYYLYYTCQHSSRHPDCGCPVRHLPAAEVEEQVLAQLGKTLTSPEIVAGVSRHTGVPGRELLGRFSDGFWQSASPGERQRLVRLLLESVTIMSDCLKLELRTAGLKSVAEAYANEQKKEA